MTIEGTTLHGGRRFGCSKLGLLLTSAFFMSCVASRCDFIKGDAIAYFVLTVTLRLDRAVSKSAFQHSCRRNRSYISARIVTQRNETFEKRVIWGVP